VPSAFYLKTFAYPRENPGETTLALWTSETLAGQLAYWSSIAT
jgi:hypothetical protein